MNNIRGFMPMFITTKDLARTLEANTPMLVEDDAGEAIVLSLKYVVVDVLSFPSPTF
jgi:hypothetical protein